MKKNNTQNPSKPRVDYGDNPFIVNIEKMTLENTNFRRTLWTGKNLQLTLMDIPVSGEIGPEMHPDIDQFIRIESGRGIVQMGEDKERLNITREINSNYAFIIPAGTWHNFINIGKIPVKLYSIYAPPQHPKGTLHKTKADENKS